MEVWLTRRDWNMRPIHLDFSLVADYFRRTAWGDTSTCWPSGETSLFSSRRFCSTAISPYSLAYGGHAKSLKVERNRSHAEIIRMDLQEMTSFWNPKLARRNITERFDQARIAVVDQISRCSWQVTAGPCKDGLSNPITFPWDRTTCSFSISTFFPNIGAGPSIGS